MTTPENLIPNLEAEKARIFTAYDTFRDAVAPFTDRYAGSGYDTNEDSNLVNQGQNTLVFRLELGDKSFVVKVPRVVRENVAGLVNDIVEANVRVLSIPGYERIVAASPEGVIVSEQIVGSDLADISPEDLSCITDDQIDNYVQAIIEGHAHGISIDPKPANVMYDPEKGFTIVDYSRFDNTTDEYKASPTVALSWGVEPFVYGGLGDGDRGEVIRDSSRISEIAKMKLPIIEKYIKAVEVHLGKIDQQDIFPNLDSALLHLKREAFDMEGLILERETIRRQREMSRLAYDPAIHGELDSFV